RELLDLPQQFFVALLLVADLFLELLVLDLGGLVVLLGLVVGLDQLGGFLIELFDAVLDLVLGRLRVGGSGSQEASGGHNSEAGRCDSASRTPTTLVVHGGPRSLRLKSPHGCMGAARQGTPHRERGQSEW